MPQGFVSGYTAKAYNGFMHSFAFTTGKHPEPIRIKQINKNIVLKNCLNCHEQLFKSDPRHMQSKEFNCLHCHQGIGHFR
jgi:cytochrome c nitrite reductase small subunit